MSGQSILIYLPYGDPEGFRTAELTTRTVRLFEVPRPELSRIVEFGETEQSGIYFLFGQSVSGAPMCYIGESDNVRKRLTEHDAKKDFWNTAVVAVSTNNSWHKAHINYLEYRCLELAKLAAQYQFDNGQGGHLTQISPPLKSECDELLNTIRILISTLGYQLMEIPDAESSTSPQERFYVRKRGVNASGTYNAKGMTVFSGSTVRLADPSKNHALPHYETQQKLLEQGVLEVAGNGYVFVKDHPFKTPSGASATLLGGASNGWDDWVNEQGLKLKDVKRPKALGGSDGIEE